MFEKLWLVWILFLVGIKGQYGVQASFEVIPSTQPGAVTIRFPPEIDVPGQSYTLLEVESANCKDLLTEWTNGKFGQIPLASLSGLMKQARENGLISDAEYKNFTTASRVFKREAVAEAKKVIQKVDPSVLDQEAFIILQDMRSECSDVEEFAQSMFLRGSPGDWLERIKVFRAKNPRAGDGGASRCELVLSESLATRLNVSRICFTLFSNNANQKRLIIAIITEWIQGSSSDNVQTLPIGKLYQALSRLKQHGAIPDNEYSEWMDHQSLLLRERLALMKLAKHLDSRGLSNKEVVSFLDDARGPERDLLSFIREDLMKKDNLKLLLSSSRLADITAEKELIPPKVSMNRHFVIVQDGAKIIRLLRLKRETDESDLFNEWTKGVAGQEPLKHIIERIKREKHPKLRIWAENIELQLEPRIRCLLFVKAVFGITKSWPRAVNIVRWSRMELSIVEFVTLTRRTRPDWKLAVTEYNRLTHIV